MSEESFSAMRTMLVSDALIVNHYPMPTTTGSCAIAIPAGFAARPRDHNMSLFKNDVRSDWESGAWTPRVLSERQPSNSRMTFRDQCAVIMGASQHEMLRKALDVTLENDPAHSMEHGRIEALNDYLHAAARSLLDLPVVDESQLSDQLDALRPAIENAPVILNEQLLR